MREASDWRLTTQLNYLKGVPLAWQRFFRSSGTWEHDHCEFCWAKFMDEEHPKVLREGYATLDQYHWVCAACFEDFKDLFEWKVQQA
jgi:hypothetical protein